MAKVSLKKPFSGLTSPLTAVLHKHMRLATESHFPPPTESSVATFVYIIAVVNTNVFHNFTIWRVRHKRGLT